MVTLLTSVWPMPWWRGCWRWWPGSLAGSAGDRPWRIEWRRSAGNRHQPACPKSQPSAGALRNRIDLAAGASAQFKAADKDNNGHLDTAEARQSPLFSSVFKLMDRDGDGKLYEKERLAYLDEMQTLQDKAMASCVSLNIGDLGKGLFDLLDTDHDGRLSVREMRQAAKLIGQLDKDGDGMISMAEIPRSYQLTVARGAAGGNPIGPMVVVISKRSSLGAPIPSRHQAGPLRFRKMDRNRDDDVSRRELLCTQEEFDQIDTEYDGLISRAGAERYDASKRQQKHSKR